MDTFNLINIILITIIYSTFIAPALTKLSSIRDDIAEIIFPKNTQDENYDILLQEAGEKLDKKLTLYDLKYNALKITLDYFSAITFIIMFWLVSTALSEYKLTGDSVVLGWLVVVVAALIFLWLSVKKNMIIPHDVRSIHWLTGKANINNQYFRKLTEAQLNCDVTVQDAQKNTSSSKISMIMKRSFYGQRFILIISDSAKKIYHVSSGFSGKNSQGATRYYYNGEIRKSVTLGEAELYKGEYKASLYLFDGAFNALSSWNPIYTELEFKVTDTKQEDNFKASIHMNRLANHVEYTGSSKEIRTIICKDKNTDSVLSLLLEEDGFRRVFVKKNRNFTLDNINGLIDRHSLAASTKRSVYFRKAARVRSKIVLVALIKKFKIKR